MTPTPERVTDRIRLQFRIWSPFYDSPFFQRGYYRRIHRRLLAAVGEEPPEAVLDIGCGTGQLLRSMARRWPRARLVGLDLSPHMLAQARRKEYGQADVTLVEGSVEALPFEDGAFDLVTNTISSHFYRDLDRALAEVARVTRPGGRLIMASLTNGPLRRIQPELRGVQGVYRSPRLQRRRLEAAGFTVERDAPVVWPSWLYVCRRRA